MPHLFPYHILGVMLKGNGPMHLYSEAVRKEGAGGGKGVSWVESNPMGYRGEAAPRKMKVVESLELASEGENMVLDLRTGSQNPTGKSLSVLSPNTPASRKLSQGNNPKEKNIYT